MIRSFLFVLALINVRSIVGKPQARVDTCTTRGGSCIRSNIHCDGYVDQYALGCRKNVCCKPAPSTVNPEPAHPESQYVLVVLDTGEKEYYRWTFDQENLLFYKSSPDSGYAALPVGTPVRRGRHWNYDDQDGGPDEKGVVIINKDGGRLVKVCWRSPFAAHELNVYRYGDQERFDIDVAESPLIDLEGLIDSGSPKWEVCDETGNCWPLTGVSALELQDSVALKKPILTMKEGHTQGTFRLEGDKLTDFNTNKTLWIRKMEET